MEWKRILKGLGRIAGIRIWIASLVPMLAATAMAYAETNRFELKWGLLSLLGIMLIETGKHCLNDIVDYKSGVDLSIEPDKVTPFSGGKKVLTEGLLTLKEAKYIGIITLSLASAIGLFIAYFHEPGVLAIGLLGTLLACAYSLPPFSLCYRGLGELTVGITYGPLIFLGMYLVMAGKLDLLPALVSIPIGILIANVLWINQYPDYEADKKNNKRNWVVRLGKEKGLRVYSINFIAAYAAFLLISVYTGNLLWILGLSSLPMAVKACRIASVHYNHIGTLVRANQATVNIYQLAGLSVVIAVMITDLCMK
ncbi:MAG: 1,4-dihydroxy-2-naphthoate octaprenyltransferase [Bacillota bacterium]|jgi:1,4-dihydroxy-2-naphthoate octaprenyltransferase|nr:1,4-dihydroxy-2-naphthoate octaprenyltransferase [Bacillota bacterium]